MDAAILKHDHPDVQTYHKVDEIPFDFERRRSSVVVDKSGSHLLITKGAPEFVICDCTHYDLAGAIHPLDDATRKRIEATFVSLSEQGYRTLAVAYREIQTKSSYHIPDEKNMVVAGFLAFSTQLLRKRQQSSRNYLKKGSK